jgi:C-terminal processing protease CtpA/Prc
MVHTLQNGWRYSLSNEVYTSPRGECFEKVGVPPDVKIDLKWDGPIDHAIAAVLCGIGEMIP